MPDRSPLGPRRSPVRVLAAGAQALLIGESSPCSSLHRTPPQLVPQLPHLLDTREKAVTIWSGGRHDRPADRGPAQAAQGSESELPGISLPAAIARARTMYEKEGRHGAPISAIARHWNYKSHLTGPVSVTLAALIKFGLLEYEGSGADRIAKLTPLALDILMKPEPAAEIKEAALRPPIHREMWTSSDRSYLRMTTCGTVWWPSDRSLRPVLLSSSVSTERR